MRKERGTSKERDNENKMLSHSTLTRRLETIKLGWENKTPSLSNYNGLAPRSTSQMLHRFGVGEVNQSVSVHVHNRLGIQTVNKKMEPKLEPVLCVGLVQIRAKNYLDKKANFQYKFSKIVLICRAPDPWAETKVGFGPRPKGLRSRPVYLQGSKQDSNSIINDSECPGNRRPIYIPIRSWTHLAAVI